MVEKSTLANSLLMRERPDIADFKCAVARIISGQVRDWISKAHPNFGFVIGGPTGMIDPSNPPENNDAKVSWYGNIRLHVIYNPTQNPRAPQ